jgi:acyl transferase domain-containing protein
VAFVSYRREPVAVVGVGCRFPGGEGLDAFWSLLTSGADAIGPNPGDRWDCPRHFDPDPSVPGKTYCNYGGFIADASEFDASFFNIGADEACCIDPVQGMVLEMAWQALESAAIVPMSLSGGAVGVFIGLANSDFDRLGSGNFTRLNPVSVAGASLSVAANRVSFALNLRGPSMVVDIACASSLGATHLACQSLSVGECDVALSGGARLILSPEQTIAFSDGRAIARDGHCRSFDRDANGMIWGEGCGILVLKRLRDAQACGDPILAIIPGSALGHGGFANGLGTPSPSAYANVIVRALESAGMQPDDVRMIEGHGAGTAIADAIELRALASVFQERATGDSKCYVGSVKSCIGHLEAAAGAAALIKAILAVKHGYFPPHVNWAAMNPLVRLAGSRLAVTDVGRPWPEETRCAGVSSFSLVGGAAGHVLVKQAPPAVGQAPTRSDRQFHILTISAKTDSALLRYVERYREYLSSPQMSETSSDLADLCFTSNVGRTHFAHRLAVVAASASHAASSLRDYCEGRRSPHVFTATASPDATPLALNRPNHDERQCAKLAAAYVQGSSIDWAAFAQGLQLRRRSAPTYPFERKRHTVG